MSDTAVQAKPRERRKESGAQEGADYAVYDPLGQKIGRAEEVFVNREGVPGIRQGTSWDLRATVRADPGAVRRDRRDEKNPRPQVGSPCIPRKPRTKRSGDVF